MAHAAISHALKVRSVGRNNNSLRLRIQALYDLADVCAQKRFAACHIRKAHRRQLVDQCRRKLLVRHDRMHPALAHCAAPVAAVCDDHGASVQPAVQHALRRASPCAATALHS